MIISGLLNAIYSLLDSVFSLFNIPGLPNESVDAIDEFFSLLDYATPLINFILPIDLTNYFKLFFAMYAFDRLYPVIMWILRKIPMLGIG